MEFRLKCHPGTEKDIKKQKKIIEDVSKSNLEKLKEKVTSKTNLNFWVDDQGTDTLLTLAIANNDLPMIDYLVANGAILDFRVGESGQWKTPLHIAAVSNKPSALKVCKLIQLLLRLGAWHDVEDSNGLTPLFHACTSGSTECALRLLLSKGSTSVKDEVGKTCLHQAALSNFDCIVALLLDFNADMHAINVAGNTPLHVSATRNFKETTRWLLKRGADPNIKNKSAKTPQDLASQANSQDTLQILTAHDPTQVGSYGFI